MAEKSVAQFDVMAALSGDFTEEQDGEEFLWPGLGRDAVGMIAGQDNVGKSYYANLAAVAVACPDPKADLLGIRPKKHGKAIHFVCEDSRRTVAKRLAAIGSLIPESCHKAIQENLVLIFPDPNEDAYDLRHDNHIKKMIVKTQGAALVIADTLNDFHGDDPNNNKEMLAFMKGCARIAHANKLAWLNIHYPSKQAIRNQEDTTIAAAGSSWLSTKSRYLTLMREMTVDEGKKFSCTPDGAPITGANLKKFVWANTTKASSSSYIGGRWLRRNDMGVLLPIELAPAGKVVVKPPIPLTIVASSKSVGTKQTNEIAAAKKADKKHEVKSGQKEWN